MQHKASGKPQMIHKWSYTVNTHSHFRYTCSDCSCVTQRTEKFSVAAPTVLATLPLVVAETHIVVACSLITFFFFKCFSSLPMPIRPKLKNIDRSTAQQLAITVGNVTVIITDFKEKTRSSSTSSSTITSSAGSEQQHQSSGSESMDKGSSRASTPKGDLSVGHDESFWGPVSMPPVLTLRSPFSPHFWTLWIP